MALPKTHQPPRWVGRLMSWICKEELLEEIEGDLFQYYQQERQKKSSWKAKLNYAFHALNFLRPFALKKIGQHSNSTIMYKNYFLIAARNFQRNKLYSALNLSSLIIGLTSCLVIFLYIKDELSFDKHHEGYEQIYRVVTDFKLGDREINRPLSPALMAEHLTGTVPEVENAGRIMVGQFNSVVDLGEKLYQIKNATYATSEILSIFTIPFVAGNPENALDDPKTVVISESMAKHLFSNENALGKTISFNNDPFIVKGIYEDMPTNGHFKFDFIMSVMYQDSRYDMGWMDLNSYTYIKLREGASVDLVESKLNETLTSLVAPMIESTLNVPAQDINKNGNRASFYLQALKDIHLKSDLDRELQPNGSMATIKTISWIGFIVLIIAAINFVNLSTARASIRGKEVGVRKVLGSKRKQLVHQFLFESTCYSFAATVISVGLVLLILPYFNQLAGKNISFSLGGNPPLWSLLIGLSLILGIAAGFYPAIILSSFNPSRTIKGRNDLKSGKSWLRSSLVVLQFSISTSLIIVTLIVNDQLNFVMDKSLGFDKDQLMTLNIMDLNRFNPNENIIRDELLKNANIEAVSKTAFTPVDGSRREFFLERLDMNALDETVNTQAWPVQDDYVQTLGLEIIEGKNFSSKVASDSNNILINEKALQSLQLTDPIGKKLKLIINGNSEEVTIGGVIKNFHFSSMKETIKPLILYQGYSPWSLSVRFNGAPQQALLAANAVWEKHAGGQPFVADIVSEKYKDLYKTDDQMKTLVNSFSALAVFVAALGLIGLASFMAEQRKREIGIRKVLGASTSQLFFSLLKGFSILVAISCLIAVPLAYLTADSWLTQFAYRIPLSPFVFIGASLLMLGLAWLTVSYRSLSVARNNPANVLRSE